MPITQEQLQSAKEQGVSKEEALSLMKTSQQRGIVESVYQDDFIAPAPVEEDDFISGPIKQQEGMPPKAAAEIATYTAYLDGDLRNQSKIRDDLIYKGSSPAVTSAMNMLQQREDAIVRGSAEYSLVDPSVPMEEKPDFIREILASRKKIDYVDLKKAAITQVASSEPTLFPEDVVQKTDRISRISDIIDAENKARQYVINAKADVERRKKEGFYSKGDETPTEMLLGRVGASFSVAGEFVSSMMPGRAHVTWAAIYKDVFGEYPDEAKIFSPGLALAAIKDKINASSPEEKFEIVRKATDSIKENSAFFGTNEIAEEELLNKVFDDLLNGEDPDSIDWDKWETSATAVLDLLIASDIIKSTASFAKVRTLGTPMDNVVNAAPNTAQETAAAAIADPKIAEVLGTTPEDIALATKPAMPGAPMTNFPSGVAEKVKRLEEKSQKIIEDVHYAANYTDEQRAALAEELPKIIESTHGGKVRENYSSFSVNEDGTQINATVVLGRDDVSGYVSVESATEGAKKAFGSDVSIVGFKWKNPETNLIEDFDPSITLSPKQMKGTEFFPKIKHDYMVDFSLMQNIDRLVHGDLSVSTGILRNRYSNDPTARLSKFVNLMGIRALSLEKTTRKNLDDMITSTFGKLPNEGKLKVADVLEEGSELERTFTPTELVARGVKTNDEMNAYYAFRKVQDTKYMLEDRKFISGLRSKGMLEVENASVGYKTYAKPFSEAEARAEGIVRAYDPQTNTIINLEKEDLEVFYKQGKTLARGYEKYKVEGEVTKYLVVNPSKGTSVRALPKSGVLKYREGYITRMYEENYFIEVATDVIEDGAAAKNRFVFSVASSKQEAKEIADAYVKAHPKAEVNVRLDRSFESPEELADYEWDLMRNTGGIHTGHRGDILNNVKYGQSAKRKDLIESVLRSNAVTAKRVASADAIASLKASIMRDYADLLPKSTEKGIPIFPSNLKQVNGKYVYSTKTGDLDKRVEEAQALVDYVFTLERSENLAADYWRELMLRVASFSTRYTEGTFAESLGVLGEKGALGAAKWDPLGKAKALTFYLKIVPRMGKHFLLGSAQQMMYVGIEPKYMLGRMSKDWGALQLGMGTIDNPEAWAKVAPAAAKSLGMSVDEYKGFVRGFKDSGLIDLIDSHSFARESLVEWSNALNESPLKRFASGSWNAMAGTLKVARLGGFEAGEYVNKSFAYLLARKRWLDANPGGNPATKKAAAQIAGEAEILAGNMSKMGAFQYQKNWLSLATQFTSFQQKMMLNMLPEKLGGSRYFTGSEKARIATGQFLLWGARGLGVAEFVKWYQDKYGVELSATGRAVLEEGLLEYGANHAYDALVGEEGKGSQFALAATLAPAGGTYSSMYRLIQNAITMDAPELFAGASMSTYKTVRNAGELMFHFHNDPNLDDAETLNLMLKSAGTVLNQYDDIMKMSAQEKMGYFVDRNGNPTVKATYDEIFLKTFTGIQSVKEREYYYARDALMRMSPKEQEDRNKDIAQKYYNRINDLLIKFADEAPENVDDMYLRRLEEGLRMERVIFSVMDASDAYAVKEELNSMLSRDVSNRTSQMVEKVSKLLTSGKIGSDRDYMLNVLKNNPGLSDQEKELVQQMYDYSIAQEAEFEEYAKQYKEGAK